MPGCWSWPPICASSTNRRTRSGLSRWSLEQDLDGQVAAQVGVAALEDGAHAAAGDLAEELVADRRGRPAAGISGEAGWTTGRAGRPGSVSRSRTRGEPARCVSARVAPGRPAAGRARRCRSPRAAPGPSAPGPGAAPQQAGRAEPARGVGGQRRAAVRAAFVRGSSARSSPGSGPSSSVSTHQNGKSPPEVTRIRRRIHRGQGGEQGAGSRPRRRPGRPPCGRSPRGGARR